jgi:hypothetical protein
MRIAVLSLLATIAVIAAAFGIDRGVIAVHRFYVEHHHATKRTAGTTNRITSTTTTTAPGPPRCDSPQLGATVSDWRETSGTVEEKVSLTNISATPCTLAGYPTLGATAQSGTPLPAPTDDVAGLDVPGTVGTTTPPAPVVLLHGSRASFDVRFANVCSHVLAPGAPATGAPNECYAGIWLEVTPPQGSAPLLVTEPLRLTYATTGFQVGPFQAGNGTPLPGPPSPTIPATRPTGPPVTAATSPTTTPPTVTTTTAAAATAGTPTSP